MSTKKNKILIGKSYIKSDLIYALSMVNPDNVIPGLEQAIEMEQLSLIINPEEDRDTQNKIRDLTFLLDFLRLNISR